MGGEAVLRSINVSMNVGLPQVNVPRDFPTFLLDDQKKDTVVLRQSPKCSW